MRWLRPWDYNTLQAHTSTDGFTLHNWHSISVACHSEQPVLDPGGSSQEKKLADLYGFPTVTNNGS